MEITPIYVFNSKSYKNDTTSNIGTSLYTSTIILHFQTLEKLSLNEVILSIGLQAPPPGIIGFKYRQVRLGLIKMTNRKHLRYPFFLYRRILQRVFCSLFFGHKCGATSHIAILFTTRVTRKTWSCCSGTLWKVTCTVKPLNTCTLDESIQSWLTGHPVPKHHLISIFNKYILLQDN